MSEKHTPGPVWLIYFDDYDRRPEIITDEDAARERYRQISAAWNAHLFVKVQSNSRDDPLYAANAPDLAAEVDRLRAELDLRRKSGSLVDRMHNLCEGIAESADGSEWSREEWERIDAENAELRRKVETLEKDAARLDMLALRDVVVRRPVRYGSLADFSGRPIEDDPCDPPQPWDIRTAIDAALAATKQKGGV